MREPFQVSDVRFVAARSEDAAAGMVGWVSLTVGGLLRLEGIALRRTSDGRLVLAFPRRRDGFGRRRYYVRPRDDCARRDIEHQVFEALGLEEVAR